MAVTVTDDVVVFDSADAVGNWSVTNFSQPAVDPDAAVQGTNCIEARGISGGGVGTITANPGNTNVQDKHMYGWVRQSWIWATVGAGVPGVQARLSSAADGQTNFIDFATAGQDKGVTSFKGWVNICQDIKWVRHGTNGTEPERANGGNGYTQIPTAGYEINFLTGNNKVAAISDEIKFASILIIGGGTTADPGTCDEISTNDETNGDGWFKKVGGVFFCNIGLRFGNTAAASSEFQDQVRTIVFEDWNVAADHYVINHRGNATGTNNFQLGEKTGTGVNEVGSNGCVIQSAGNAPWHIHCEDANTDLAGYYGCTFIGPPSFSVYGDSHRDIFREDNSAASFTYVRADLNNPSTLTSPVFTTAPALNDATYFGNKMPFNLIFLNTQTAKNGTYTIVWEYWNGSAWASLPRFKDGSNNFSFTGGSFLTWDFPDDWVPNAVNSRTNYWVRVRISAFTSSITAPVLLASFPYQYVHQFFLTSSFEMITGSMIGMGPIKLRNGANLKRVSISGSVGPYALDLGDTDPAANTVRDLSISNCPRGLLLRGGNTSPATVTYNLRNITFSNNGTGMTTIVEDNSLSSFAFQATEPNDETANNVNVFPATPALNDAFYISHNIDCDHFNITVGTAAVGTFSVTWEYWNGSAWTALSGVTDGTNGFTTTGLQTVSFTRPTNHTWTELGATGFFGLMIRARISSFTSMSTNPLLSRVQQDGDIRIDWPASVTVELNILEGGSAPTIDNVNGSTVNINNNVNVTITNLQEGSEVRVYGAESVTSPINTVEIAGVESVGSPAEFTFSSAAGSVVDIVIHHIDYVLPPNNRITDFVIPASDTSFPVSQIRDRNFNNP